MRASIPLLAVLYIALPSALFAAFFLPLLQGLAVCVLWCLVLGHQWRVGAFPVASPNIIKTWPLLLLAAGAVWLAGALPPFYQNSDWAKHYALFDLMIRESWPPTIEIEDVRYQLRYPMGFYIVPSLITKIFGLGALDIAIFLWMTVGVYLALALAFSDARNNRAMVFSALILLAFSGLDVLGYLFTRHQAGPANHIEWWASFGQISSSLTNLFWAPQHALPAWIAGILLFRYPARSIGVAAPIAAAVMGWSPFAMVGLAPFAVWCLIKSGIRPAITFENAAGLTIGALVFVFLTSSSANIPVQFIWQHPAYDPQLFFWFLTLEFGMACVAIALAASQDRLLIAIIAIFLAFTSLIWVGVSGDLLMRGPSASLAVLAVITARTVTKTKGWTRLPIFAVITLGLATPMAELTRAYVYPRESYIGTRLEQIIAESPEAYTAQYLAAIKQ